VSSAVHIVLPAGAPRAAGDRSHLGSGAVLALSIGLLAAVWFSVVSGPTGFMPQRALAILFAALTGVTEASAARETLVVLEIRAPRAVLAVLVGAALATAGCVMQSLFRNPLADPGLVGTSSGAALAAVAVIVLGDPLLALLPGWAGAYMLPAAAFAGALSTTAILYAIATREGRTSIATMLLAGIAVAALAMAALGLFVFISDDSQLRELTFWTLGSLGGASWAKVAAVLPFMGFALLAFRFLSRCLDAMLLGETEAQHLGVSVQASKRLAIAAVAAAVGASVAVSGTIGFVGIVVPHLLRLVIGPTHRALLPASALAGGTLLIVADTVCRTVVAPAELPIGILTALFGAPMFLWLLLRRRGLVDF
jgi:iron complex transport system permease protein